MVQYRADALKALFHRGQRFSVCETATKGKKITKGARKEGKKQQARPARQGFSVEELNIVSLTFF